MLSQIKNIKFLKVFHARKTSDYINWFAAKDLMLRSRGSRRRAKNPWGGSFVNVADELSRPGKLEDVVGLFEFDILQTPNKSMALP